MSNSEDLHSAALAYHRLPRPGKLEIQATKPLANIGLGFGACVVAYALYLAGYLKIKETA